MPSAARNLANLLGGSATIPQEKLGNDISTIEQVSSTDALTAIGNTVGDQRVVGNNLYIWNGTGWYRIALINTTPTWDSGGQPASAYELSADSPQTATTITLAASDPEGLSIDYSYVTSGSMDSMATISQDSSVFTITPKTLAQLGGEGNEGPYTGSITFRASDGVNILPQVSSFTLKFITTIENSKYTIMHVNAIAASDNNNITDTSTNNHSITVNGDAHAGTFSPYRSGGYSVHLDDGEEISFPDDANYNISNGSFSIEAWVYPTSYDSPWSGVISQFSSSNRGWGLAFSSTQITFLGSTNGGSSTNVLGSVTSSVPLNQWTHLLVTRSSNTIRIFNNGVLVHNFTEAGTFNNSTNPLRIGELNSAASENFRGYLRDIRFLKGSIPTEYQTSSTTNGATIFSVPSEPLTVVTDTVLLTCHLPYISDGSANNATPTLSGNVSTKPFSPYDYLEYSATDNGGSVYFDTSDDYLTVPNGSWKTYGSSNFTIECWFYADRDGMLWGDSSTSGFGDNCTVIAELKEFNGTNAWVQVEFRVGSTKYGINPAQGTFKRNSWNHIALVRNGNTFTVYSNGKDVGNTSQSGSMNTSSNDWAIASGWPSTAGSQFNGYISDFRVSKSARYTAEFTPPTAPLSSSGAELHLKGTDASIIDKSQVNNLKLIGNTTGSTTQVKFASTKSMYFDGSGDDIRFDTISLTGDFTLEYWIKLSTYNTDAGVFGYTGTTNSQHRINHNGTLGRIMLYVNAYVHQTTGCFTQSEAEDWMHIAYSRQGENLKLYVNGIQKDAVTTTLTLDVDILGAGGNAGGNNHLNGYLQDFRITKGLARYTANFTPPTASLEG